MEWFGVWVFDRTRLPTDKVLQRWTMPTISTHETIAKAPLLRCSWNQPFNLSLYPITSLSETAFYSLASFKQSHPNRVHTECKCRRYRIIAKSNMQAANHDELLHYKRTLIGYRPIFSLIRDEIHSFIMQTGYIHLIRPVSYDHRP